MALQLQFHLSCSKLSFRTLYDFDLNEAMNASMILLHKFSIVVFIKEDCDHPYGLWLSSTGKIMKISSN